MSLEGVVFPVKPVTGQVGFNTRCPRTPVSNWAWGRLRLWGSGVGGTSELRDNHRGRGCDLIKVVVFLMPGVSGFCE